MSQTHLPPIGNGEELGGGQVSPAGGGPLNADSSSVNGLEVGVAPNDDGEAAAIAAELLREVNVAVQARAEDGDPRSDQHRAVNRHRGGLARISPELR